MKIKILSVYPRLINITTEGFDMTLCRKENGKVKIVYCSDQRARIEESHIPEAIRIEARRTAYAIFREKSKGGRK